MTKASRTDLIVEVFRDAFDPLMKADPLAFRTKYRKMAADPHAFYRGSACLYYADVTAQEGPVGRRARAGDLDPRRPARRELRHLPELQRPARLRHQRLRRGLHRPLHLGPAALRRQPGAARLAEGAARGRHRLPDPPLRARLPRPGRPLRRKHGRGRRLRAAPRQHRRAGARGAGRGPQDPSRRAARRDDVRRRRGPRCSPRTPRVRHLPKRERAKVEKAFASYLETIPRVEALRPRALLRPARRRRASPGSASAAPACRRTTCWSRVSTRRSTTTWCCR